jgi:hypothetical protein
MASHLSEDSGVSSNSFAALLANPKWQELVQRIVATSSLSDGLVEEAFEILRQNRQNQSKSSTSQRPNAWELLQCDSEWGKLLCTAGSASGKTKIDVDVAFRLLQANLHRTRTPHPPPLPNSSPSQSEHESTGAEQNDVSESSYASLHGSRARPAKMQTDPSSDDVVPNDANEANDLYELGKSSNASYNAL